MAGLSTPAINPGSGGGGGGGTSSTITSLLGITTAGQKAMSGSLPVVIASDQSAIPVSGSITANTPQSVVSTNNSSVATLTSGSVFTGTADDCLNYSEIRVTVISNVASATDGISIQQSSDSTNWDITDVYTIAANTGKTFVIPRQARYMRVVYTNGGTGQASFRLQTILNKTGTSASSQRPADAYTNETDLIQQQSFVMGYNGTTWDRLRSTTANGLAVDVTRLSALVAGAAIIGKVGIDQTTPGTTNLVALAANQSVNVAQINGVTTLMGNGTTGTGSQRVTIASDNTPFPIKIDQTTPGTTNAVSLAQIGGTTIVNGGLAGSQSIGGTVATNVAITDNPVNMGGQGVSSENSAVTTGRKVQFVADLVGKQIVLPYANPENFVSGRATATDTTSTSLIASPGGSLRNYITQITVWNSSATSTYIKIQDGSGGTELYDIPAPAGGGATLTLPAPLRQPTVATALFFAANASASAIFISASGYKGL